MWFFNWLIKKGPDFKNSSHNKINNNKHNINKVKNYRSHFQIGETKCIWTKYKQILTNNNKKTLYINLVKGNKLINNENCLFVCEYYM